MAIEIGEHYTGHDLIQFLLSHSVPPEIIVYPNTKWRMLYEVLLKLSSGKDADYNILVNIITSYLHPLNFAGNEKESHKAIELFNQWLKYDNLELNFHSNKVYLNSMRSYQQIKEDEEHYVNMVDSDTGEAIHLIKTEYLSEIVLLKKCYQLLINIVESSLENPSSPNEKLNEAYLKLCRIAENAKNKIFNAVEKEGLISAAIGGYKFYKPFRNLYSVEAEKLEDILHPTPESIKAKMNAYFGEIVELCLYCEAGDVLDDSETQKLLNGISLYLTELREKNQKQDTIPASSIKIQKLKAKFDKEIPAIFVNEKEVKIPYATNQSNLCEALFEKPKKRWENDELLEIFGVNIEDTNVNRQPYDAMLAVNKKVADESGVTDLILCNSKTFKLNPKYLP